MSTLYQNAFSHPTQVGKDGKQKENKKKKVAVVFVVVWLETEDAEKHQDKMMVSNKICSVSRIFIAFSFYSIVSCLGL
jgi:hypothetical protein